MPSDLREALWDLEQDVNALALAPVASVRARGEARRRRHVAGATVTLSVVVGATVTGAVYLSSAGQQPHNAGGANATSTVCPSPRPTFSLDGREVRVFLWMDATAAQREAVGAKLRGLRLDATVDFQSHQEAWNQFLEIYCDASDVLAQVHPDSLPESFIVTLTVSDAYDYDAIRTAVADMPGVDTVVHR